MTLEEYYKAERKIIAPPDMAWYDKRKFYKEEKGKLRSLLSPEVLEKVLRNERHLSDKMQSGVGIPVIVED